MRPPSRAFLLDTTAPLGQGRRLDVSRALASRPNTSLVDTRAGSVRVRRQRCDHGPRVLFAADGPNTIEHYDGIFAALAGRADVTVFDPPGTGGSAPRPGFDFSVGAFAAATEDLLVSLGGAPPVLVAPCYFGYVALRLAADRPDLVGRLVLSQTPSWRSFLRWADRVDRERLLRTPFVGQALVAAGRRRLATLWYRGSAESASRAALTAAAHEALAFGGCFALASLMQSFSAGGDPEARAPTRPTALVWGERDRSHRGSEPYETAGMEVVRLADRGHSPEVESPARFADWLLGGASPGEASALQGAREQAALAEQERRLNSGLVEALPGIFYLYNEEGRFLRWNTNFERVSGYAAEEIARMHPTEFFAAHERETLRHRIAEVFTTGESSVEASFVAKGGAATPYFFTGKRVVLDGATCLAGVGIDIAEQTRSQEALRRSEERYRTTLDNILESCQLLDFDWRYLYLNDAAAVQNRRPNAELLGHRMPDAWPGIEATPVFALLRGCMEGRVAAHEETEFSFADGAKGWFDVRVQPVPEGIFVLSIDISERKQAERALRELNEVLERKVAARTIDLEAAKVRAEAADRIKSAFLATMSHELRTPLNSILGFTGIILQGMAGPLNPEQSKQLGMVQGSARHLLDLINDVLDISKIEAGQLEVRYAPFDLLASVERVAGSVTPLATKKGLALRVVVPAALDPMESDRRRVEQVLLNLLNNAIKFTDRGEVTLTIKTVDDAVRIEVADTGIGLRPEDLSQLFQPFRQIDSGLQRQHEGTGLGLAICRRLTGLLGGTIRAESVFGEGSRFIVALPMRRGE